MNSRIIKFCMLLVLAGALVTEASAQRTSRNRNNQQQQQQPSQQQPSSQAPVYNPYANVQLVYDTISSEDAAAKPSLRNDNAFDKSALNDRTPLPYEHLRWDDAFYAEKVWRELDLREKLNQTFRYEGTDDEGSQVFVSMLLRAVNSGAVTAFEDERFTTPMELSEIARLTQGDMDTTAVYGDLNNPDVITQYTVTRASFNPQSVLKLRIKEEWVFDREASRMFVRILGIAPVKTVYNENGTERGTIVLFWLYYPDLRPILARYEVYNPKNMGTSRMTWEELFESRMFSSYIIKSTLDNPQNKNIRQLVKDPILALLEGENIKERIFNFEQDLWEY